MPNFAATFGRAWPVVLVFGCMVAYIQIAFAGEASSATAEIVHNIGSEDRLADDIAKLTADRAEATRMLIGELHVIPRKTYYERTKTIESLHVIGCLRALHYLTGHTFSARSTARLTDDERQFLDFNKRMHDSNPGHQLHFFGVWMSRNADVVAPIDVQRKIIQQWRNWKETPAQSVEHAPCEQPKNCMDYWFWFG